MPIQNLKQKFLLSLLLAVSLFAAFTLYADVHALQEALTSFRWWFFLPVLVLTALNLFARFIKWEYYLRLLEVENLSWQNSAAIFFSNFALILTPGKMGGLLKSYFVKQSTAVPMARTMPIILAERLTDGLGMILMTAIALIAFPAAWPVVALVIVGMVAVLVITQYRPLAMRLLAIGERLPLLNRFATTLHVLYESSHQLLQWRALLWATLLGTVARATEGIALYFVLLGLGVENSLALFVQSLFIAALSNVIGVVVMMPGGLGGTEGSMVGLLSYFVGLAAAPATASTLLARLGSLWVPALLGFVALYIKRDTFFAANDDEPVEAWQVELGDTSLSKP